MARHIDSRSHTPLAAPPSSGWSVLLAKAPPVRLVQKKAEVNVEFDQALPARDEERPRLRARAPRVRRLGRLDSPKLTASSSNVGRTAAPSGTLRDTRFGLVAGIEGIQNQ
jgi:hypothetical protein